MRRSLYAEMNSGLRRRPFGWPEAAPPPPEDVHLIVAIVIAVGATSDGFLLLHKLQPELFGTDLVVETQWNVVWSMTEPGCWIRPAMPIPPNGLW